MTRLICTELERLRIDGIVYSTLSDTGSYYIPEHRSKIKMILGEDNNYYLGSLPTKRSKNIFLQNLDLLLNNQGYHLGSTKGQYSKHGQHLCIWKKNLKVAWLTIGKFPNQWVALTYYPTVKIFKKIV